MSIKKTKQRRLVRPGPVSESEAAKREATILRIATTEFLAKGFHGASISVISTKSRISKNTLYGLFGNKRELFSHIATASISRYRYDLERALDHDRPFVDVIRHVVELLVDATTVKSANAVLRLAIVERHRFPFIGQLMFTHAFKHVQPLAHYLKTMSREDMSDEVAQLNAYHLLGLACGGFGSVLVPASTLFKNRALWVDVVVNLFVSGFPLRKST
jgi:AcrR family transcriptional regulator